MLTYPRCRGTPWLVVFSFTLILSPLLVFGAPAPDINYPAELDLNGNRLLDDLDAAIEQAKSAGVPDRLLGLIVVLYRPPGPNDLARFTDAGGKIDHVYRHAIYGFSGSLPADRVLRIAATWDDGLAYIETNRPGSGFLDVSTQQVRARPLVWADPDNSVWQGYDLNGDPDIVIAIVDSGIDNTHTDLAGRIVHFKDFVIPPSTACVDSNGHGTHVTGIAAGTGAVMGSGSVSSLTTTFSDRFPAPTYSYMDGIRVPVVGAGQVTLDLYWAATGTARIYLKRSNGSWVGGPVTGSSAPLINTWSISSTDHYKAFAGNDAGLGNRPFSMLLTYPYTDVGDGFNLFRGMASECNLVGLKVLDVNNSGWTSIWIAAFNWLVANNQLYDIKVANASFGLNGENQDPALRTAANSVVAAGTVLVVAAGNGHPFYEIPDPGLAEKAITVGAIDDFGSMTHYSSNGPSGFNKPDVVAPGGSWSYDRNFGSEITSCDNNLNDAWAAGFTDRQANDYANLVGTSMATPHVAGLAALVIQAKEQIDGPWSYSEDAVLDVKRIILATATETNRLGEDVGNPVYRNNPSLNRGGRDKVEGYGRINTDAAVEAVLNDLNFWTIPQDTIIDITFGAGAFDRQAWATRLLFYGDYYWTIDLDNPAGLDADIFVYDLWILGGTGEPQLAYSSTQPNQGVDEHLDIHIAGTVSQGYLVVARRVSGSGVAALNIGRAVAPVPDGETIPTVTALSGAAPNPFNPRTAVRFTVSRSQRVRLAVHDLAGRLVRLLVDRTYHAGAHTVTWDGRDDAGRALASGAYVVQLTGEDVQQSQKLLLVR